MTRTLPGVVLAVIVPGIVALGCGGRHRAAIDRLEAAVADYAAGKPEPTEPQIDALFAQVDADVAALRAEAAADPRSGAAAEAAALQRRSVTQRQRYVAAKVERLRGAAEEAFRDVGKEIGRTLEEAGRRMQESMEQR